MTFSRSRRLSAATAATGMAFIAEAFVEFVHPQAQPFASAADYAIEALFAVGLALAALTWSALRSCGVAGRVGSAIAAGGYAALALSATATVINGADTLGPVFMLGLLAALVGSITVAASAPSRALGGVLTVGLIASMLVGTGGAAILGLAWIATGALLRPAPTTLAGAAA